MYDVSENSILWIIISAIIFILISVGAVYIYILLCENKNLKLRNKKIYAQLIESEQKLYRLEFSGEEENDVLL